VDLVQKIVWHFKVTVPDVSGPSHECHSSLLDGPHIQLGGSRLQHYLLHSGTKFVPILPVPVKERNKHCTYFGKYQFSKKKE
jgi:hypothetical protein